MKKLRFKGIKVYFVSVSRQMLSTTRRGKHGFFLNSEEGAPMKRSRKNEDYNKINGYW